MVVSSGPVPSTGPTSKSPNSIQAVRERLEKAETAIKRLEEFVAKYSGANAHPDASMEAGAKLLVPVETMNVAEGRRCRIADPVGHVWTLTGP